MEFFIILFAGLGMMMFFGMRKQKKMAQAQQQLQDSISEGDRVMTTAGLYATVADASDDTTIDLEIADGVVTTWLRQAIREKVGDVVEDDETDVEDTDEVEADDTAEVEEPEATEESGAKVAPPLEHGTK